MTNTDDNDKDECKKFEIVKIGRYGISYSELKEFHNISMSTLNNISKIISSPSSPQPTSLYSSKDVKISKTNNNWLLPYNQYKENCKVCKYYGHSIKSCPNLQTRYRWGSYCINCWEGDNHQSNEYKEETRVIPFNEEFKSPEEILNFLIYK